MSTTLNKLLGLYWQITVILILLFLSYQNALTAVFELPAYLDEIIQAFMLMCIFLSGVKNEKHRFVGYFYILSFVFLAVISKEAFSHRGIFLVFFQIFIHLKYIAYIGFLFLFVNPSYGRGFIYLILVMTVVSFGLEMSSPGLFHSTFEQPQILRSGGIRPIGFQGHTSTLAFFLAFAAAYFICVNENMTLPFKALTVSLMIILVLMSTTRTAMVVFPLIFLWALRTSFLKALPMLIVIIGLGSVFAKNEIVKELVEITEQNIESTIENPTESAYIRGMMLYFSFELANNRFPFGTGAATFGTVASEDSNIYAELGVQNSRYFIDTEGIYDSNFASLLGEFGYPGVILYYLAFLWFCKRMRELRYGKSNAAFYFVVMSLMLAYSITNPVFMNAYQIFVFALVLLAGQKVLPLGLAHDSKADRDLPENSQKIKS